MTVRHVWIVVAAVGTLAAGLLAGAAAPGYLARQEGEYTCVDTPHYRVRTDLGTEAAQLIAAHQEALFAALMQRMSSFKPAAATALAKLDILAVKTKEKYLEIVGKDGQGTQGVHIPAKLLLACWGPPEGFDITLDTLRHEGTHQFEAVYLGPKCPVWLNEGLAEFFRQGQFRGGQLVIGQAPMVPIMNLRRLIADGKFLPVADIVNMTHDEWNAAVAAKGAKAAPLYQEAWAMVHCLEAADNGKYQAAFIQYMSMVSRGIAAGQAWERSFGAPPAAFEKRLREYIQTLKPTCGIGCRWNLKLLGALVVNTHGLITDMKALRQAAEEGKLGTWTYSTDDGLKIEMKDAENLKTVFRCAEDTSKGDDPSYELVPGKPGEPMIVRCRHHAGYVLETTYTKQGNALNVDVIAQPSSTPPPVKPATPPKKPAPTGAPKP
jgi:hypothetical protein